MNAFVMLAKQRLGRPVWISALVCLAVLVLIACAPAAPSAPAAPASIPVVLVGDDHTSIHQTFSYRMNELCPAKYGFAVQHVQSARYTDRVLLLQKGDIHFGAGGYSALASIAEQNIPVVAIAGQMNRAVALLVRNGVDIKSWKDLEGKKVAVAANSIVQHNIIVGMKERGLDPAKMSQVTMVPGPQALISLEKGEIDAISAWEPWAAQGIVDGIGYIPFDETETSIGPLNGLLMVNKDWLAKNRQLAVKFTQCMMEAMDMLTKNPDLHAADANKWTGVTTKLALASFKNFEYDPRMFLKNAERYAEVMFEFGLTKVNTKDKITELLDYSVLQEITGKTPDQLGRTGFSKSQ